VLALASASAQALTIDAKALARFDNSYLRCEALFPDMRGQRDEAYLSLWRVRADEKARAELSSARKSAAYQAERRRVQQAEAKGTAPAASSPIEQQCQALRGEARRNQKARK
jgi:hypothetical protein